MVPNSKNHIRWVAWSRRRRDHADVRNQDMAPAVGGAMPPAYLEKALLFTMQKLLMKASRLAGKYRPGCWVSCVNPTYEKFLQAYGFQGMILAPILF